jgi:predicted deacylase
MKEGSQMDEHIEVPIENMSYGKFVDTLMVEAKKRRIPVTRIGEELSERTGIVYPLYRLEINPEAKKNICIVAGIHGVEVAGPLSVLMLLQSALDELSPKFKYVVYPMINPSGFDLKQRHDDDDRDLNAIYSATLTSANYGEVQAFYRDVQQYKQFDAAITLHEDIGLDKFYMYGLGKENVEFYHELCHIANGYCASWMNADIYGKQSDEFGLVLATAKDHAFDGAMYSEGLAKIAFTIETPGKLRIKIRTSMMLELVTACSHMLAARN